MANIGTLTAHIGANTRGLNTGLAQAQGRISGFSASAMKSIAKLSGAFAALGLAVGGLALFKNITKTGIDFEQTMTTVAGVMRATAKESKALTAAARKMGETTEWSASEAGGALQFLGMAGFEANKAIKALPGTLDLATAGQIGLGRAADIATNALTAMGLDVEELERVNDVFVGTITRSNTNMEMMAESFKYAAPVARAYGYTVEELSGLIGMLGNAGIQGSMAGTQLAESIRRTNEVAEKFGVTGGKFVDVLEQLREKGYASTEVMKAFGVRAGKTAGVLYEATDATKGFQETLRNVQGEAGRLADKMRSTIGASFKELKSVIESLALDVFETYRNELKDMVVSTTTWIRENKDKILAFVEGIKAFLGGTIEVISSIASLLSRLGIGFTDFFKTVESNAVDTANAVAESGERIREALDPPELTPWQKLWEALKSGWMAVGNTMYVVLRFAIQYIGIRLAGLVNFTIVVIDGIAKSLWNLGLVVEGLITKDFIMMRKGFGGIKENLKEMWTDTGEIGKATIDSLGKAWKDMVDSNWRVQEEYYRKMAAAQKRWEESLLPAGAVLGGFVGGAEAGDGGGIGGGVGAGGGEMISPVFTEAYESWSDYMDYVKEWIAEFKEIQENKYQWLYAHEQISADEYLAFLEQKLSGETEYKDAWMTTQAKMESIKQGIADKERLMRETQLEEWKRAHQFEASLYESLGRTVASTFRYMMTSAKNLQDVLKSFIFSIRDAFLDAIAEIIAKWITMKLIMGSMSFGFGTLFKEGGLVGMQAGGLIGGPRWPKDSVPIMATGGEYMMPRPAVASIGLSALEHMRRTGEVPARGNVYIDMGGFTFSGTKRADAYLIESFVEDKLVEVLEEKLKNRELVL